MVKRSFQVSGIVSDKTKFGYILGALNPKYAIEVRDIIINLLATGAHEKLKHELIRRLSPTQDQKTRLLFEHEELGDRKLLRHLRSLGGSVGSDGILRTLWIGIIPRNMQAFLATQKDTELDKVAELADAMSEYLPSRPLVVAEAATANIDAQLNEKIQQLTLPSSQEIAVLRKEIRGQGKEKIIYDWRVMASSSSVVADVSLKSNKICKRCNKKFVNGVTCINCKSYYHSRCADSICRENDEVILISDDNIMCCSELNTDQKNIDSDQDQAFFDAIENLSTDNKIDINIFTYILKQKDLIISGLRKQIQILMMNDSKVTSNPKLITKTISPQSIPKKQEATKNYADMVKPDVHSKTVIPKCNVAGSSNYSGFTKEQLSTAIMQTTTEQKCSEIINLNKDTSAEDIIRNDGFTPVTRKKQKRHVVVGNNNSIKINGKDVKTVPRSRFDPGIDMSTALKKFKNEIASFIMQKDGLVKSVSFRSDEISDFDKSLDYEQHSRSKNIVIQGIPKNNSENSIVEQISNFLGVVVKDNVKFANRVQSMTPVPEKPRNIVVGLAPRILRYRVRGLAKKKRKNSSNPRNGIKIHGNIESVYINEHLTSNNQSLLRKAKEAARTPKNLQFFWVENENIFMKKDEGSCVEVIWDPRVLLTLLG
ncbi:unnamed protein product [Phaedon cochleariae]|uniref:Phorbol-ester/DAG-type domain-containing protein n=1 Tax=Phaedon cochleariae TaxID=80249 RepID=A0A9N9SHY6_PHACE|nr:unnamed protein product [Phaedon cochleariae]